MLEDIQLRCQIAADTMQQALTIGKELLSRITSPEEKALFETIQRDADYFRRVSLSYALHIRETNVAQQLRQNLAQQKPLNPRLVTEMGKLLDADVINQDDRGRAPALSSIFLSFEVVNDNRKGRVIEMRRLIAEDPAAFVLNYLVPTDATPEEEGQFTLTTR